MTTEPDITPAKAKKPKKQRRERLTLKLDGTPRKSPAGRPPIEFTTRQIRRHIARADAYDNVIKLKA